MMGHSYRHQPFGGVTTASSDKAYKKIENKKKRKRVVNEIQGMNPLDYEDYKGPCEKLYGDPWCSSKDGKITYTTESKLRKYINASLNVLLNCCKVKEHFHFYFLETYYSSFYLEKLYEFVYKEEKDIRDISLQELFWIPNNLVEKFIKSYVKREMKK